MRVDRPQRYNVELLRATRDKILMEPEAHDQRKWAVFRRKRDIKGQDKISDVGSGSYQVSCPTVACTAGWATVLSGAQMLVQSRKVDDALSTPGKRLRVVADHCITPEGQVEPISVYAQRALGLSSEEAGALFAGYLSRQTVLDRLDIYIKAGEQIH